MIDLGETLGSAIVHRPRQSCDALHRIGRSLGAFLSILEPVNGGIPPFWLVFAGSLTSHESDLAPSVVAGGSKV